MMRIRFAWATLLFTLAFTAVNAGAQVGGIKPGNGHPLQGYFYVGGRYVDTAGGPLMERQMYVVVADFIDKWIVKTVK